MSLSMYARITPDCVTEQILEEALKVYFAPQSELKKSYMERYATYENFFDNNDLIITFIKKKIAPYNIYESEMLNKEYMYNQAIIFNINKNSNIVNIYHSILKFCKYLQNILNADMLITSDSHGEICFIKASSPILWSDASSFINKDQIN